MVKKCSLLQDRLQQGGVGRNTNKLQKLEDALVKQMLTAADSADQA